MLYGILLIVTWIVLLIRFPTRALPISAAALVGLGLVIALAIWQDSSDRRQLDRLELRIAYAPTQCPADRPLALSLKNGSDHPLRELRWKIAAYRPGETTDLAENLYEAPRYRGPGVLLSGAEWKDCLPLPPLRPGYRASTLEFRAERIEGAFGE
ncbi:multidrug transporter [Pseudomonas schmalbachii]|uniref:Multidrug transporter n=1 Tax=Pseudomonas schmalbachii TaxID=2816993 RepID=A0ABS3TWK7_9PSED|nr:multidrug transporter [Pseudomonas schmalbachii]MBO3277718.1 multidrug transporter [Pseudomonas schmalbachii]